VGVFRRDTDWTPFSGAVTFEAASVAQVPTLSPYALAGLALALALVALRRLRS
jgi:hypothetical protein